MIANQLGRCIMHLKKIIQMLKAWIVIQIFILFFMFERYEKLTKNLYTVEYFV